eukprot:m.106711 g.106711  ORF g.106711 m.106711 type:complete len:136 (+) comp15304_c0_seq40:2096-2503(+)
MQKSKAYPVGGKTPVSTLQPHGHHIKGAQATTRILLTVVNIPCTCSSHNVCVARGDALASFDRRSKEYVDEMLYMYCFPSTDTPGSTASTFRFSMVTIKLYDVLTLTSASRYMMVVFGVVWILGSVTTLVQVLVV